MNSCSQWSNSPFKKKKRLQETKRTCACAVDAIKDVSVPIHHVPSLEGADTAGGVGVTQPHGSAPRTGTGTNHVCSCMEL